MHGFQRFTATRRLAAAGWVTAAAGWVTAAAGWVTAAGATALAVLLVAPPADAGSGNRQHEATVELGRRLFLDPVASRGGLFSCASCHEPEHGFSDPRQFSVDENGTTARHSQPVTDLAGEGFHWDGEFDTVRQLLVARLDTAQAALEQTVGLIDARFVVASRTTDNPDRPTFERKRSIVRPPYYGSGGLSPTQPVTTPPVVARLDVDGRYDDAFRRAFGSTEITPDRVVDAVDAYLATLATTESAWDRFRRGQTTTLSPSARRGLSLFRGKAGCDSCHVTKGKGAANLSDGTFHDTGVAFRLPGLSEQQGALVAQREIAVSSPLDAGRGGQTFVPADAARFKTPSLRDVARRAPYMHDGSLATLRDVVEYYDRGATPHAGLDKAVRPLDLTDAEKGDLVEFLESLTGSERAGLGEVPSYRGETTRIRLLDPYGRPVDGLSVTVTPTGDRLAGTQAMPTPFTITTDRWGWLEFPFPLSTQVLLDSQSHEIALDRMVPDSERKLEVTAAPRDMVTVVVRRANPTSVLPGEIQLSPLYAGGQTSDDVVTLTRTHKIDADRAIYAAALDTVRAALPYAAERPGVDVRLAIAGERVATFPLDLTGGQSEPFDLRVDTTRTISTTGTTAPERRGRRTGEGGVKPPTPRADPSRPATPGVKKPDVTPR